MFEVTLYIDAFKFSSGKVFHTRESAQEAVNIIFENIDPNGEDTVTAEVS